MPIARKIDEPKMIHSLFPFNMFELERQEQIGLMIDMCSENQFVS
jgi:hypothetical protein